MLCRPLLASPMTRSPGRTSRPTMIRSSGTVPTAVPTRSKPLTTSRNCAISPPGDRDAGLPRPFGETDRDAVEHRRVGPLDRDVIDQRQRLGADAEQVVDIHRDAVDADRVVAAASSRRRSPSSRPRRCRCPIRCRRYRSHSRNSRSAAAPPRCRRRTAGGPCRGDTAHDIAQARIGLGDIDAGALVGVGLWVVVAHGRPASENQSYEGCGSTIQLAHQLGTAPARDCCRFVSQ